MRAYRLTEFGQEPVFFDIDQPLPGPGEVAVAIRACGLNFADLLCLIGNYQVNPTPPFTLGMELAGVVTALGESVTGFSPGDRVAVFAGQGGLAEAGVFPADRLIQLPDAMPFEHAAAFPVAYGTSHLALARRARLQPGETLLVTGAAGGVGLTAVEIGKLMGARVIAQARGADKLEIARRAGADHLIDASDDLRARLIELGRADVVYDAVGGTAWEAAFRACNPEARLIAIGFASGEVPQIPANHLLVKNLTAIGFNISAYHGFRPDAMRDSLAALIGWYTEGRLKPHVSHVLPFDRVDEGLELLRARKSTGKVVISIG